MRPRVNATETSSADACQDECPSVGITRRFRRANTDSGWPTNPAKRKPSFAQALEPTFIRMKDVCFAFEPTVHRDMIDVVIKHILTTP